MDKDSYFCVIKKIIGNTWDEFVVQKSPSPSSPAWLSSRPQSPVLPASSLPPQPLQSTTTKIYCSLQCFCCDKLVLLHSKWNTQIREQERLILIARKSYELRACQCSILKILVTLVTWLSNSASIEAKWAVWFSLSLEDKYFGFNNIESTRLFTCWITPPFCCVHSQYFSHLSAENCNKVYVEISRNDFLFMKITLID